MRGVLQYPIPIYLVLSGVGYCAAMIGGCDSFVCWCRIHFEAYRLTEQISQHPQEINQNGPSIHSNVGMLSPHSAKKDHLRHH